jgi:hypothetical protein
VTRRVYVVAARLPPSIAASAPDVLS